MVLPAPDCTSPSEACCNDIFNVGHHILTQMLDALTACMVDGCQPLTAYVTVGEGDAVVDAVTVTATSVGPMSGTRSGMTVATRAVYLVRLIESGWPVARGEGGTFIPPAPMEQQRAVVHVFARAEAMYRRLLFMAAKNTMGPPGVRIAQASVAGIVFIPPSAGTVGSSISATVDMN